MARISESWKQGPDRWFFTPEGALIRPDDGTLVIADLHLGYEATRAQAGDFLPNQSLKEIQHRLSGLFQKIKVQNLVIAGDVTESQAAFKGRITILDQFLNWVGDQNVETLIVAGNHDRPSSPSHTFQDQVVMDAWLIHHGHKKYNFRELACKGEIVGHWHPVIKWQGRTFRAFLSSPERIVLPAFSGDAAGLDLLSSNIFQKSSIPYECWACSDSSVINFGKIQAIRSLPGG